MQFLNRSFTVRLHLLEDTFSQDHTGKLKVVETISGTDEISQLMQHYNSMANRMNHLIETVYESRLNSRSRRLPDRMLILPDKRRNFWHFTARSTRIFYSMYWKYPHAEHLKT